MNGPADTPMRATDLEITVCAMDVIMTAQIEDDLFCTVRLAPAAARRVAKALYTCARKAEKAEA